MEKQTLLFYAEVFPGSQVGTGCAGEGQGQGGGRGGRRAVRDLHGSARGSDPGEGCSCVGSRVVLGRLPHQNQKNNSHTRARARTHDIRHTTHDTQHTIRKIQTQTLDKSQNTKHKKKHVHLERTLFIIIIIIFFFRLTFCFLSFDGCHTTASLRSPVL